MLTWGFPLLEIAEAYERIGVAEAALIFRRLQELLPDGRYPRDFKERLALVDRLCEQHDNLLSELAMEFRHCAAAIDRRLVGWIRLHRDVFDLPEPGFGDVETAPPPGP